MRLSKFKPTDGQSLELSTTSMIDVVFLLLIFFLVTTTYRPPEHQIRSNIRVNQQSSAATDNDIEPAVVEIVLENQTPTYRIGMTTTVDLEILSDVLDRYPDKTRGAFVQLSNECPFGMAAAAVARCHRAGFSQVSMVPIP
ncbi:MAG: biopolymer transporter ExbD [Planctomycetaceae bacterium]|nr:biopolymer transporter ExbD [Planctomycetaceae bacterium]MCP4463447.1 biopolymer transporter ExbD [Planctomycetaceae bacterium]MDG2102289.1 biopolymer transporter ExbD [Pirellulaceae bacterium]